MATFRRKGSGRVDLVARKSDNKSTFRMVGLLPPVKGGSSSCSSLVMMLIRRVEYGSSLPHSRQQTSPSCFCQGSPHPLSEFLACARRPRFHRALWNAQNSRGLADGQSLDITELKRFAQSRCKLTLEMSQAPA